MKSHSLTSASRLVRSRLWIVSCRITLVYARTRWIGASNNGPHLARFESLFAPLFSALLPAFVTPSRRCSDDATTPGRQYDVRSSHGESNGCDAGNGRNGRSGTGNGQGRAVLHAGERTGLGESSTSSVFASTRSVALPDPQLTPSHHSSTEERLLRSIEPFLTFTSTISTLRRFPTILRISHRSSHRHGRHRTRSREDEFHEG